MAVAGDLTVTGNDIKSSTNTALTLSGANVTVAGDLTVTGNTINSSGAAALELSGANVIAQGDLTVKDNEFLYLGDGQDLQIYHSTNTNNYIQNNSTGDVIFTSIAGKGDIVLTASNADILRVDNSGTPYLRGYYSGSEKIRTTSSGVTVYDTVATGSGTNQAKLTTNGVGASLDSGSNYKGVTFAAWAQCQILASVSSPSSAPISPAAGIGAFNVDSVDVIANGRYKFNFTTGFANTNYLVFATAYEHLIYTSQNTTKAKPIICTVRNKSNDYCIVQINGAADGYITTSSLTGNGYLQIGVVDMTV